MLNDWRDDPHFGRCTPAARADYRRFGFWLIFAGRVLGEAYGLFGLPTA